MSIQYFDEKKKNLLNLIFEKNFIYVQLISCFYIYCIYIFMNK